MRRPSLKTLAIADSLPETIDIPNCSPVLHNFQYFLHKITKYEKLIFIFKYWSINQGNTGLNTVTIIEPQD